MRTRTTALLALAFPLALAACGDDDAPADAGPRDAAATDASIFGAALPLPPGGNQVVPVRIKVPEDAQTGAQYSINVRATDAEGRLAGGVTFLLRVQN